MNYMTNDVLENIKMYFDSVLNPIQSEPIQHYTIDDLLMIFDVRIDIGWQLFMVLFTATRLFTTKLRGIYSGSSTNKF